MSPRAATALGLALVAALASALYVPYLSNPAVFDDIVFYSGLRFSEYALSPFGAGVRFPAYFTLAWVETYWGRIEAHRVLGLLLHLGCGAMLYALLRELRLSRLPALACAACFVVHPAAVYAAGYLIQRTIVLATLFGLASLLLFVRGLREARLGLAIVAALAYAVAVLSKEHAIMVPAVALAALPLVTPSRGFALRYAGLYAALCVPAALLVVLFARGVIGTPYEGHFATVTAEVAASQGTATVASPWIGSALAQAALFFRYVLAWLVPQTSTMAIDIKVEFARLWAPAIAAPAVAGFLAWGLAGAALVWRSPRFALAGFGMLYAWLLYLPEFAVLRYQEPFVLYRSYLWAPGILLPVAVALGRLPPRLLPALVVAMALFLAIQARDRLETFSSSLALWEDAAAKLPAHAVPGAWRTYYMLGREYLYAERPARAVQVVERCMALYPDSADCQFGRAAIHMHREEFEPALPYLVRAIELARTSGAARHHLGWAL
jgi:protein O-mannosyl-transferase